MRKIVDRLRDGERLWAAELLIRGAGAGGLGLFAQALGGCCRLVSSAASGRAPPLAFFAALLAAACLSIGIALMVAGPGLLRPVPMPPRAMLP